MLCGHQKCAREVSIVWCHLWVASVWLSSIPWKRRWWACQPFEESSPEWIISFHSCTAISKTNYDKLPRHLSWEKLDNPGRPDFCGKTFSSILLLQIYFHSYLLGLTRYQLLRWPFQNDHLLFRLSWSLLLSLNHFQPSSWRYWFLCKHFHLLILVSQPSLFGIQSPQVVFHPSSWFSRESGFPEQTWRTAWPYFACKLWLGWRSRCSGRPEEPGGRSRARTGARSSCGRRRRRRWAWCSTARGKS